MHADPKKVAFQNIMNVFNRSVNGSLVFQVMHGISGCIATIILFMIHAPWYFTIIHNNNTTQA